MKKFTLFFAFAVILSSCNTISDNPNVNEETQATDIESLKKEVMAVHDTAMVKMNTISQLQRKLMKSWKSAKDSLRYMDVHHDLGEAHDDMMDWMRTFEIPENANDDEVREYLLEEKKAIEAVNANMDETMEEARFLLKNSPVSQEVLEDTDGKNHEGSGEEQSHQH